SARTTQSARSAKRRHGKAQPRTEREDAMREREEAQALRPRAALSHLRAVSCCGAYACQTLAAHSRTSLAYSSGDFAARKSAIVIDPRCGRVSGRSIFAGPLNQRGIAAYVSRL